MKNKQKSIKHKKKAFTLIELLAVIIILGVLAIIAIPSVSKYINDSRKISYISSSKSIADGVMNLAHSSDFDMSDVNTTYYVPAEYIKTENGLKTPYGEFTEAYVGVICNGKAHTYYWVSRDSSGIGVKDITPVNKLDIDNIEENINENEITNTIKTTGIGRRTVIKVLNQTGEWDTYSVSDVTNNALENGNKKVDIVYPSGKTKQTVSRGNIVKVGNEEFYVIKRDGDDLILLARYNLKVGSIYDYTTKLVKVGEYTKSDPGYGMQSSEATGYNVRKAGFKGGVYFSKTNYWVNDGLDYPREVFDDRCNLKKYVDYYEDNINLVVKEARLLKLSEATEMGCNIDTRSCSSAPSYIKNLTYWLQTSTSDYSVKAIIALGTLITNNGYNDDSIGIRPVIVI